MFELLAGYAPFHGPRPIDIYEKILGGIDNVSFPSFFSLEARDIIRRFLTTKSRRLGNTKGGIKEIKQHNFFISINWQRIKNREIAPPAVPNLQGNGDRANFNVIADPPSKFNMFSEDGPRVSSEPNAKQSSSWSRAFQSTPANVPDFSVFDDWETTIYI